MEKPLFKIIITGNDASAIVTLLRDHLAEMGVNTPGTLQVECNTAPPESSDVFIYTPGTHDTPPFAVEKILDTLAERGWICLDAGVLSPEEEEQIRVRLQSLGYVD